MSAASDTEHAEHAPARPALPPGVKLAPGDPALPPAEQVYVPAIARGLANTLRHVFKPKFTIDYDGDKDPAKRHIPRAGYRGEHCLKRDAEGRVKCVACFMCAAACPAECIHIEAAPTPPEWKDRERYPRRFEIDLLRCIYCGMCEEACPVDAIALTPVYNIVSARREDKVYDRERLLKNGDEAGLSLSRHEYRPDGIPGRVPGPEETEAH